MKYQSIFRSNLFEGQVILITGGGSGIGRCMVHELAALGAHPILIGRKIEKLRRTAEEIEQDAGQADFHVCDVREDENVKKTVARVVEEHGRIHGLVNNAGGQFWAPLVDISQKGFETVVRTNLVGGFLMAREVFVQSMRDHGGTIVNIVSDYTRGTPGMGHSGASRAGMVNFTQTAAIEWAPAGVRVNAVAPGVIASSGFDSYGEEASKVLLKLKDWNLLKRFGTEAEVSAAVVFLLSEGSAFITGETIEITGGSPLIGGLWANHPHDRSKPFNPFHRSIMPRILR